MNIMPKSSIERSPERRTADIRQQLWRQRYLFALVFVICMVPVLVVVVAGPRTFYSAGLLIIGEQEPVSNITASAWIEKLGDPADLESQLTILRSPRMLRLSLSNLGTTELLQEDCRSAARLRFWSSSDECAKLLPGSESAVTYLASRYFIQAVGRSRLIEIGYRSLYPEVASILANTLLITYLDEQRGDTAKIEPSGTWMAHYDPAKGPDAAAGGPDKAKIQSLFAKLSSDAIRLESEQRRPNLSTRLVSLAEIPSLPIFPRTLPVVAAGALISAILAGLASLYRDAHAHAGRPNALSDLSRWTDLPILAVLKQQPKFRGEAAAALPLLTGPRLEDINARAIDELGSQLILHKSRIVSICSAQSGEGKSMVALGLAKVLSVQGFRVLLVDCNFQHPKLQAASGDCAGPLGIQDYLAGNANAEDVITASGFPRLDLVSAGKARAGSAILLLNGKLAQLLCNTRDYDYIVLDGPAFTPGFEATAIGLAADAVVWCVRWTTVTKETLFGAITRARRAQLNVLGLLPTMVNPKHCEVGAWLSIPEARRLMRGFCLSIIRAYHLAQSRCFRTSSRP
jgi:Mrp family chromosome partitioning ATPase